MKYIINEKQLKLILSKEIDLGEQDAETVSSEPTAGTSSTQSGGQGYPAVGKWESGVTRGAGNQIGVTKWSDVVGSTIKRGKANPLKEQSFLGLPPTQSEKVGAENVASIMREYPHATNTIMGVGAGVITVALGGTPIVAAAIAGAIGLYDSSVYFKEGDTKTGYLIALFSVIPFVSEIPGVKELGAKGMSLLAVKVSKGLKLTNSEKSIVVNISKRINALIPKVKAFLKKKIVRIAAGLAAYGLADEAYSAVYDYYKGKEEEENLKKLADLIQQAKTKK